MTATIYNGRGAPDAARTVSFALPAGDYSGLALTLDFLCNRIPAEIDGDGCCFATIPEEALRTIPCGTHRAALLLRGTNGQEAVFASVPIRVSDIPGEASAYADVESVTPSFAPANAVTADALAEALAAIDAPGTGATQKTLRETLAALVTALKTISSAVAGFCLFSLAAAGESIPWEQVPPDTPVDPAALLPVAESDPTVPAWAKAPAPPLTEESDPVFARWAETNGLPKALPVVNNVQLMPKVYVSGGQWLAIDVNTQTQLLHWAGGPAHATTNMSSQISIDVADSLFDALDEGLDYVLETATNYTDSAAETRLSRAEAEDGFTEWKCEPTAVDGKAVIIRPSSTQWYPTNADGDSGMPRGTVSSESLTWAAGDWWGGVALTATRTRLRPTPAMEAAWDAKLDDSDLSGYATSADLAGYSPTGHVHALSDITGVAAQTWIFTLTNGVAITNEVLVREESTP